MSQGFRLTLFLLIGKNMAEVARLEINVRARVGRAISQLAVLNGQLNQLQRSMTRLSGSSDDLMNRLNRLTGSTNRVAGSTGNARRRTDGFNNALRRTGGDANNTRNALSSLSGIMPRLLYQFIAFGVVSLAPLLVESIALLGALSAVAGVAAVSLGAFFLAAVSSSRATEAFKEFQTEFRSWQESLADFTGPPIERFLEVLADNLDKLNPIVETTSGILLRGAEALGSFLDSKQFISWMDEVNEATKTILPNLGRAFGDFIIGFMELIRAFLPMGEDLSGGLAGMAASFREWAEGLEDNQGFQNFTNWIYQNTPRILDDLGAIVQAVFNLSYNLRDLGSIALGAFANVAEAIGSLDEDQITAIGIAIAGVYASVQLLSGVSSIASGISSLSSGMALLGGTGGIVAVIVLAVAAAMFIAWQRSETFRNMVTNQLWPALQLLWQSFQDLYDAMQPMINLWLDWITIIAIALVGWVTFWTTVYAIAIGALSQIINWLRDFVGWFSDQFNRLPTIAKLALAALAFVITGPLGALIVLWRTGWTNIRQFFANAWNSMISTISSAWRSIVNWVTNIYRSVTNWISQTTTNIRDRWNRGWQRMVDIIRNARQSIINSARSIRNGIVGFFSGSINWLYNAGRNIIRGLRNGIANMAGGVLDYVRGLAGDIAGAFTGVLDIFSPSRVFIEYGRYIVEGLTIGMDRNQNQAMQQSTMLAGAVVQPFATGGPTLMASTPMGVTTTNGTTYNINFDGAIITGNPREVEDLVVNAIVQAQRKGRLRGIRTV